MELRRSFSSYFSFYSICCYLDRFKSLLFNKAGDKNGTCRLLLDLEVVSETVIVIMTGGPGALVWMVSGLLVMMLVNASLVYFAKPENEILHPTEDTKRGVSFLLYSLGILCITIYTTILFQTKQMAVFLPNTTSFAPLLTIFAVMSGILLMIKHRKLVTWVYLISAAGAVVYVIGIIAAIYNINASFIDSFRLIFSYALEPRAIACGYVGACAIGSYVFNIKSSDRMRYKLCSPGKAAAYSMCEYAVTLCLCTITGLAVVISGTYKTAEALSEFAAPLVVMSSLIGALGLIIPMFAVMIVMTETYYSYQYWKDVVDRGVRRTWRTLFKTMPVLIVLLIMLFGTGIIDVDIMPFVHTADKLTGVAIFLPITAAVLRRISRQKNHALLQAS